MISNVQDQEYYILLARLIWYRKLFIMTKLDFSISRPNTVVWYINGQRKALSTRLRPAFRYDYQTMSIA